MMLARCPVLFMNAVCSPETVPPTPTFSPPAVQPEGRPVEMSGACARKSPFAISSAQDRAAWVMPGSVMSGERPAAARSALIFCTNAGSSPGALTGANAPAAPEVVAATLSSVAMSATTVKAAARSLMDPGMSCLSPNIALLYEGFRGDWR